MLSKAVKYSFFPFIIYCTIFYLCCVITPNDVPDIDLGFSHLDKVVHFIMYFGLTGVIALQYIHIKKGDIKTLKLLIVALLLPIIYGGIIELIQEYFILGRSGDWLDFIADILGSLTAIFISLQYRKALLKQSKR